ncbi:unnamed protein product [Caenorhabditis angaria]|uniref:RNA polymerase II-associated factor 1 homolog n=1 Tax=Caenorhabditis angaria TaxID=860376 RepID=A0A9P1N6Y5_9PELO|nr:unnamed protein product [Caenorhabditis angaria]
MSRNGQHQKNEPRKVDFMLKPRFTNTLPDIPFDGKFMPCPFVPISRFYEYKESTLEKEYKHNVVCDEDMGLNVDLIDIVQYDEDKDPQPFDEKDQILLEDETVSKINQKRSAQHSLLVPWMRKTEYISTEYNRFGLHADRQETKLGYNLKKNQQVDDMYRDRQSQIDAINKTFEDVKKPITKHYNKKGVHAVEECFVFPDFENWRNMLAYVQFDGELANTSLPVELKKIASEKAVIRGMQCDNEHFAALFTPTLETIQKDLEDVEAGRRYDEDEKYEYNLNREFTWKLESSSDKTDKDNFVAHWKDGEVRYNEIDSHIKMQRRRKMWMSKKSKLTITYREFDENEIANMETRFENLFKPPQKYVQEEGVKEEDENESGSGSDSENDTKSKKKSKKDGSSDSSKDSSSAGEDSSDDEKSKRPSKKEVTSDEDSD